MAPVQVLHKTKFLIMITLPVKSIAEEIGIRFDPKTVDDFWGVEYQTTLHCHVKINIYI